MNSTVQTIALQDGAASNSEAATNAPRIGKKLSRIIFLVSLTTATGGWIAFLTWLFLKIS